MMHSFTDSQGGHKRPYASSFIINNEMDAVFYFFVLFFYGWELMMVAVASLCFFPRRVSDTGDHRLTFACALSFSINAKD